MKKSSTIRLEKAYQTTDEIVATIPVLCALFVIFGMVLGFAIGKII